MFFAFFRRQVGIVDHPKINERRMLGGGHAIGGTSALLFQFHGRMTGLWTGAVRLSVDSLSLVLQYSPTWQRPVFTLKARGNDYER